jgi:DNA processing protein
MSFGTVVVEAAKKSGSLITARMAAEQGREVFAVPGNINSFKSTGTHELLKQGARLVESGRDVIEELAPLLVADGAASGETTIDPGPAEQKAKPVELSLTPDESRVYHALDPYPVHIDQLASILSMDAGSLLSFLLNLELKGLVCQMPGKYFCISGVK